MILVEHFFIEPVLWIRIFTRIRIHMDPHPDPDQHQFADDKPKYMDPMILVEHFFKGLKIRIRI